MAFDSYFLFPFSSFVPSFWFVLCFKFRAYSLFSSLGFISFVYLSVSFHIYNQYFLGSKFCFEFLVHFLVQVKWHFIWTGSSYFPCFEKFIFFASRKYLSIFPSS